MDDGMEDIQNIVNIVLAQRDEAKELGGEKESAGGLINNLISTIVTGGGGDEDKRSGGFKGEEISKEEEKEGGFIDHIISNLVSPRTSSKDVRKSKAGEFDQLQSEEEGKRGDALRKSEDGDGGAGGIINNLISNIFHQGQGGIREESEQGEQVKSEGGGRLVESLVFSLPTPLSEDAVPATDEASILIHSIVHD